MKYMKRFITFILVTLVVGIGYSQKKTEKDKEVITENRKVANYDAIEVSGAYNLVLTEGEVGKIKVKGQKEVLSYLETKVSNNVLYISIDRKYSLKTSITVYVPIDTRLKRVVGKGAVDISTEKKLQVGSLLVKLEGSGDLEASVTATSLDLQVAGAGGIDIAGETKNLSIYVKGAGDVDADELKAEKAILRIAGAGGISAYVTQEVDASIAGAGGITVKGNPPVFKKSVKGIGRIKIEE